MPRLIIFIEPLKSNTNSKDDCDEKLEYSEILKHLKEASLKIEKEEVYGKTLFLVAKLH